MNYASQLKGWAVDRVTEAAKAGVVSPLSIKQLSDMADELATACYIPDTDFNDTVQRLAQLFKTVDDPLGKVKALQGELAYIQEDLERQLMATAKPEESH